MNRTYLKLAFASIKENPLVSAIAIGGVAIAIAMAMVVVFVFQIQTANYRPETKRDRMLYVNQARSISLKNNARQSSGIADKFFDGCFANLKTAERATKISWTGKVKISLPGKKGYELQEAKRIDSSFFKVFDFKFVDGRPIYREEFASNLNVAVISENLAQLLFGKRSCIGEIILLNFEEYRVVGVVKDISSAATSTYANVWSPEKPFEGMDEGILAWSSVCILMKNKSDSKLVKAEIDENIRKFNSNQQQFTASIDNQPYSKYEQLLFSGAGKEDNRDVRAYFIEKGLLILLLLVLPAINLTGINRTIIIKRFSEFGIRKAFGASKREILTQLFNENLLLNLLGGILGFLLSVAFLFASKDMLLTKDILITWDMLLKPIVFLLVLLFCFIVSLLSTLLPAWLISKQEVVTSLRSE